MFFWGGIGCQGEEWSAKKVFFSLGNKGLIISYIISYLLIIYSYLSYLIAPFFREYFVTLIIENTSITDKLSSIKFGMFIFVEELLSCLRCF